MPEATLSSGIIAAIAVSVVIAVASAMSFWVFLKRRSSQIKHSRVPSEEEGDPGISSPYNFKKEEVRIQELYDTLYRDSNQQGIDPLAPRDASQLPRIETTFSPDNNRDSVARTLSPGTYRNSMASSFNRRSSTSLNLTDVGTEIGTEVDLARGAKLETVQARTVFQQAPAMVSFISEVGVPTAQGIPAQIQAGNMEPIETPQLIGSPPNPQETEQLEEETLSSKEEHRLSNSTMGNSVMELPK